MEVVATEGDYVSEVGNGHSAERIVLRPRAPRRPRQRVAIAVTMAAGVSMLAVAVVSSGDALAVGATALCGTIAIAIAAVAVAETASLRQVGIVALLCGVAFALSAVPSTAMDAPEIARLVGGGLIALASSALIANGGRESF